MPIRYDSSSQSNFFRYHVLKSKSLAIRDARIGIDAVKQELIPSRIREGSTMKVRNITFSKFAFLSMSIAAFCPVVADEPKVGKEWNVIQNSLGMKMVMVPAGGFLMVSDELPESLAKVFSNYSADRFVLEDEKPAHQVRITHPFYFGQTEVTIEEFRKFLVESKYITESERDGTGGYGFDPKKDPAGDSFAGRDPQYSWSNPGFKQSDKDPVTNVTWSDAIALCKWLSDKEGKKYRLPTEAEWEYACRAGTTTRYSSGNEPKTLLKIANTFDQDGYKNWKTYPEWKAFALQGQDGYEFTSPVGSFAPNAFGLYDMHGNVWEWCSDFHGDNYYSTSPVDDPQGPESGNVRVRRGGSWHTWPFYVRSSFRNWNTETTRYTLVGMRLVREADANP